MLRTLLAQEIRSLARTHLTLLLRRSNVQQ